MSRYKRKQDLIGTDVPKMTVGRATLVTLLNRVSKLVDDFETPFGLELLATTHWVVRKENAKKPEDVFTKIYAWNERKKQFSHNQIQKALTTLEKGNWI